MSEDLLDRIYECAVAPDLWPAVLGDLAGLADARGGLVFSARKTVVWSASDGVQDLFAEYFEDDWFGRCTRRVCSMRAEKAMFFTEHDFWSEQQIGEDPMYRDLFRPHGVGWGTWTGLRFPAGDEIVLSLERSLDRGPVEREHIERLNEIRPHLVRSAMIAGRLGLQRAAGATEALTRLGLPAVLVDSKGRVLEANPMIEALPGQVTFGMGNAFQLADRKAQDRLTTALAAMEETAGSCSISLRDEEGRPHALIHVLPIRRSAHDILGQSFALLVLTPLTFGRTPNPELLRSLFKLTPSEIRLADGLAKGQTLDQAAEVAGVSKNTVRSQLRSILEKTGCSRQADLVALLIRLSIAPD